MEIMHGHHGSLAGLGSVDLEALEERPWLFSFRDIPYLCNTPQFSSLCFTGVEHQYGANPETEVRASVCVVKGMVGRILLLLPDPNLLVKWMTSPSLRDVFVHSL